MTTEEILDGLLDGRAFERGGEPYREAILSGGAHMAVMRALDLVDGYCDRTTSDNPMTDALAAVARCLVSARP